MKRKNIRITGVALCAVLSLCARAASFARSSDYPYSFADVSSDAWYAESVKTAYEYGLMRGESDAVFAPDGNVSVAEAVTAAVRIHASVHGTDLSEEASGGDWYEPYLTYAGTNGMLASVSTENISRPVTRGETALLLAGALENKLDILNNIQSLPDVPETAPYADAVLALCRAGIVTGTDSFGNFLPMKGLTRAELAAMISRVVESDHRIAFTPYTVAEDDAYLLCIDESLGARNSGWQLDNRGAVPRTVEGGNFSGLFDVDDTAGSAMIREFNRIDTGIIRLRATAAAKGDGVYLEYSNDAGESLYRLETVDGHWCVMGSDDGIAAVCAETYDTQTSFFFEILIDLDNGFSETRIDGVSFGTYPLMSDNHTIADFRYATTEQGTGTIAPKSNVFTANYAVFEDFSYTDDGMLPYGWYGDPDVSAFDGALLVSHDEGAGASFVPQSGTVVAEWKMILPMKESVSVSLQSAQTDVLVFTSDEENFYVGGEKVYENYVGNLWYTVRIEADTDAQTAVVKINGHKVADVPFAVTATSIDSFYVENGSRSTATFDRFRVFRIVEHDDYVPEPVRPRGEEKYTVGLNVCPLWVNGTHKGWNTISTYDDIQPVLGYYDECNPETADWEIKYLVEHGVDYQAFCVFFSSGSGVQDLNGSYMYSHPFDGYMNAKYADYMKYAIIWEAENGAVPSSMDAFKQYYVPYLIEHFFKDERYMVIDNKPVMHVFGIEKVATAVGGYANVRNMFEYLNDEVRALGYDGVLYLACSSFGTSAKAMGYEGASIYSWGTSGYSKDVNIKNITASGNNGAVYVVPTVSVGFNNVGWASRRWPMMTLSDYAETLAFVKDSFLPTYPKKRWQQNFVMLSTWNEYGEGTYIMPTTDERGFGYLDAVREAFTDEKADSSINTIPTAKQLARITHLYPQTLRALKPEGYYADTVPLSTVVKVDFATDPYIGTSSVNLASIVKNANGMRGVAEDSDPIVYIMSFANRPMELEKIVRIKITMKARKGSTGEIFWTSDTSPSWAQSKSAEFSIDSDDMKTYVLDTSTFSGWTGNMLVFRVDPMRTPGDEFTIQSVEFLTDFTDGDLGKTIMVNGRKNALPFAPKKLSDGTVMLPFSPADYLSDGLNVYYRWKKDEGTLYVEGTTHTALFTVGADTYLLDGKQTPISHTVTLTDGVPVLPLDELCMAADAEYVVGEDDIVSVTTPQMAYYDGLDKLQREDVYEFNTPANVEGWTSPLMQLTCNGEALTCVSPISTDPYMLSKPVSFIAEKYKALEVRVRYKYDSSRIQKAQLYFITDRQLAYSESKTLNFELKSVNSGEEFETYIVETSECEEWKNTIKGLRFDPFNATGTMEIDYIRFIEDPDFDESTYEEEPEPEVVLSEEDKRADNDKSDEGYYGWHFHKNGNIESWWPETMTLSVKDGYMKATCTEGRDPLMYSPGMQLFADDYTTLEIRVRYKYDASSPQPMQIYFTTEDEPSWSEAKSFNLNLRKTDSGEGFETYSVTLKRNEHWKGYITRLRFDPFNATGYMDIDYIRFKEK